MPLLLYQEKFLERLATQIYDGNRYIMIEGKSGCGKTFALNYLSEKLKREGYKVFAFVGDYAFEDREYYPFNRTLFYKENPVLGGTINSFKGIPYAGDILNYVVSSLTSRKEIQQSYFLTNEDQNIVSKLRQILLSTKCVFIFDNIHWWDRRSLQLIYILLTNHKLLSTGKTHNYSMIFSITSDQEAIHKDLLERISVTNVFAKLSFPTIGLIEFKNVLFTRTLQSFSDSQIKLLYNLVNGHLQVFFEVINEIHNKKFDFDANYESNKQYLSNILEIRLRELGADSNQINKILEYASIIGITFSVFELKNISNVSEREIDKILKKTSNLSITETTNEQDYVKFAHDIIREIYKANVDSHHLDYYNSLALCIKHIKPDQYLRRARYFLKSQNISAAVTSYILEGIKQIRLYGDTLDTLYTEMNPLLDELQRDYFRLMKEAYSLYASKKYQAANLKLELITDAYPIELLAERDILKIRCYSKSMATDEVEEFINKKFDNIVNNTFNDEKDIWERYSQVLLIANSHLGKISIAKKLETDILKSLSERINYDETATIRLYIIKRVANSIHDISIASIFVKDAVDYFGRSSIGIRNIRHYYISLVNYTTILINNGNFDEAYNLIIEGFNIETQNQNVYFPRPQLLRNNYIIAGYLCGKLDVEDCIKLYEKIIKDIDEIISERLFYISNLSIFWSINNNPRKALDLLQEEAILHYKDNEKEGLYQYRVVTNSSIYSYLLGEHEKAISQLQNIDKLTKRLVNGSYFNKKNQLLISLMENKTNFSGKEWLNSLFLMQPTYQNIAWRYFGLGYAFMAVCNWDMSE